MSETVKILANSNSGSVNFTATNIANAYTDTTSTTYAQLTVSKKNSTGEIYFGFDFSSIPSNAVIQSMTVKFKGMVSSTTYISSATIQAHDGVSVRGTSSNYRSTSTTQILTLNVGTWTREELNNFKLYLTARKGNNNNTAYARVYGMEVTVVYDVPEEQMYMKQNGSWIPVQAVYKKANGAWVLQSDLASVFDVNTNYQKG